MRMAFRYHFSEFRSPLCPSPLTFITDLRFPACHKKWGFCSKSLCKKKTFFITLWLSQSTGSEVSPVSTLWLTAWLANCHLTFPGSLPLQWTWLCLLTLSLFVCFSFKWYLRNNITFRTMYCSFMWLPCFSWLLITEFYIFYSWKLEILWNCFPLKIPSWPLEQCTATSSSSVCLSSRQT